MKQSQQPALTAFAIGMIGMGVLALIYGDFALVWQPVPQWVPGRTALAYACGVIMVLGGFGLLARATRRWAVRILFPYLIIWALLKVPGLGILFSIFPRVAAYAEAAMIGVFTLLVWVPKIVATPKARLPWTAFFISWVIAAAAWVVAQNLVSGKPTEQMASEKSAAV